MHSPGNITYGLASGGSEDNHVLQISLDESDSLEFSDNAGPTYANQIATTDVLSFGTYRIKAKAAGCENADEEVITGIFVYSYGGDTNSNGMTDNNEIDIEIACSAPWMIYLTIWTDYEDEDHYLNVTNEIDMREFQEDFNAVENFYEMGFEWHPDEVRYFIVLGGEEITLWDYTDEDFIPQNGAQFMLNLWHSDEKWDGSGAGDYPKSDTSLYVDRFEYWSE